MKVPQYTCPCCGYRSFQEWPGSYEVCHVCYWEDDPVQIMDPWFPGGANRPNLIEAQENYSKLGAMEERFKPHVRGVLPADQIDGSWRRVTPADKANVRTPASLSDEEERVLENWYYWRRNAV